MTSTSIAVQPLRILFLDDEALPRECVTAVLETRGMHVRSAGTLATFFECLGEGAYNVALVDLLLAGESEAEAGSGWRALEHLHDWYPSTRVLIVSAHLSEDAGKKSRALGVSGWVDKRDMGARMLLDTIETAAQGGSSFPASKFSFFANVTPAEETPAELLKLSPRERQVLECVAGGADNVRIATLLGITERTVRAHISALYRKLAAENRTSLALLSRRLGLRPPANC